jgi:hypothetical protein
MYSVASWKLITDQRCIVEYEVAVERFERRGRATERT